MADYFAHETAIVEHGANVGKGTKIWVNSHIRSKSCIGEDCIISKDTYVDEGVKIGNKVKIQNGVSIYKGVEIEDEVFIGPNVAFTNDLYPRAQGEWKITETLIKKGTSIGANATIVCGIVLGEYAMVGAGSVVIKDLPRQALAVGNPAKIIGFVCQCGKPLDQENRCSTCGKKYEDL